MSLVGTLIPLAGAGVLGSLAYAAAIFSRRQVAEHRELMAAAAMATSQEPEPIVSEGLVKNFEGISPGRIQVFRGAREFGTVTVSTEDVKEAKAGRWVFVPNTTIGRVVTGMNISRARPAKVLKPKPDPIK